jgi:16S rRNA (uracil1498-N3)-methyltransferase
MSDRFYIAPAHWDASALMLTEDEAKHCTQVMRHREGDEIIVFNGVGDIALARITSIKKNTPALECISVEHNEQPAVRITLAPALIKADRWEWLLEKATELGVAEIQPLITERCVVKLSAEDEARKHDKWQRLLIEACKQSRRSWLPVLHPACRLEDWCEKSTKADLSLVAALDKSALPIKRVVNQTHTARTALLLIGPEGDFTPDELQHVISQGFTPVTLGQLTLRAETASISALAILTAELSTEH